MKAKNEKELAYCLSDLTNITTTKSYPPPKKWRNKDTHTHIQQQHQNTHAHIQQQQQNPHAHNKISEAGTKKQPKLYQNKTTTLHLFTCSVFYINICSYDVQSIESTKLN